MRKRNLGFEEGEDGDGKGKQTVNTRRDQQNRRDWKGEDYFRSSDEKFYRGDPTENRGGWVKRNMLEGHRGEKGDLRREPYSEQDYNREDEFYCRDEEMSKMQYQDNKFGKQNERG